VQTELLEKHRDAQLNVYAVWFNMMWSDSRDRWPPDVLTDPRVVHFWDEDKLAGRWYEENVTRQEPASDRIEWDAYFLHGPDVSWQEDPPELVSWGHPIVSTSERLRTDLYRALKPSVPTPR
jgi:hypothetical protein